MAKMTVETWRKVLTFLQERMSETSTRGGAIVLMASLLKFLPVEVATAIIDLIPTAIGLALVLMPDPPAPVTYVEVPTKETEPS